MEMRILIGLASLIVLAACGGSDAMTRIESRYATRAEGSSPDFGDGALARAFVERLTVSTRADGTRVLSRRCRTSPVPCERRLAAFGALIEDVADRHGIDPFLLGALAFRESGLDPRALGRQREAGIVQLHPRGAGRGMRYVNDAGYRARCQSEVDACQGPVIERAAETLEQGIERCGGVVAGLGAYAAGHCVSGTRYAEPILEERNRLRELAQN